MKVSLKRALRLKNKVAEIMTTLRSKISAFNRVTEQNKFRDNVKTLYLDYMKAKKRLIEIKTKVSNATEPIRELIVEMGEHRDTLAMLGSINTDDSTVTEDISYSDKTRDIKYKVALDYAFVEEQKSMAQDRIEEIQDAIDEHNSKTFIELSD